MAKAQTIGLLIWPVLLVAACNPFASISTDEEMVIPQDKVASLELLVPGRHLPKSAKNVRLHVAHFQDTSLHVRFDASVSDARAFAVSLVGSPLLKGKDVYLPPSTSLDWWPKGSIPLNAEGGEDTEVDGDGLPAVRIMLVPRGRFATVWLQTFTV